MWLYKDKVVKDLIDGFESFVYLIERLNIEEDPISPIYYVGKKGFYSRRKIKNKIVLSESDWQDYYGSSDLLTRDIEKYGKHNFKRNIIHFCRTKGDSGYMEIKEQIDRNVLFKDENGYKLYYNGNINGRYHDHPDSFEMAEDLELYFKNIYEDSNNKGKRWVNNGIINKLLKIRDSEKIIGTKGWVYGKVKPKIEVNDGTKNLCVAELNNYKLGYILKKVTDGINNKLININELDDFLNENHKWKLGSTENKKLIWVTNGIDDIKIKVSEKENYPDYNYGKTNIKNKNKLTIFKKGYYKYIYRDNLKEYIKEGWLLDKEYKSYKLYYATNGIEEKHFETDNMRTLFLNDNIYWKKGHFNRDNVNTSDNVFAIDMNTNEKVLVSKEVFNNNKMLTSIKTKKIKVKKKNRILFEGYTTLFFLKYDIPRTLILKSAKNKGEIIEVKKGKNMFLNEFKYSARYI